MSGPRRLHDHRRLAARPPARRGEYLLTGAENGEYEVEFRSPPAGSLDYVHQRYGPEKAVTVVWGSITPAVDAQLHEGGGISGIAENAATGQPADGVSVCAYNALGESEACATTEASGSYRLPGLEAGDYKVGFETTGWCLGVLPSVLRRRDLRLRSAQRARRSRAHDCRRSTRPCSHNPAPGDGAIAGLLADASTSAPLAGNRSLRLLYVASEGLFGQCTISTAGGRLPAGRPGPRGIRTRIQLPTERGHQLSEHALRRRPARERRR